MATNVGYVKLSNDVWRHPKILARSVEERWAYVATLAHCQEYATDGHVTRDSARLIAPLRVFDSLAKPAKNGADPLLEISPEGFVILAFLEYQRSREQRASDREKTAARKRRQRSLSTAESPGDTDVLSRVTDDVTGRVTDDATLREERREKREEDHSSSVISTRVPERTALDGPIAVDDQTMLRARASLSIWAQNEAGRIPGIADRNAYARAIVARGLDHLERIVELCDLNPSWEPDEIASEYASERLIPEPVESTTSVRSTRWDRFGSTVGRPDCVFCDGTGWETLNDDEGNPLHESRPCRCRAEGTRS